MSQTYLKNSGIRIHK